MRRDRLQNRIAGSEMTLPLCAVFAALMWWFPLGQNPLDCVIGLALAILTAYVLMEINNRFQLIRVRTRMVSGAWILFAGATASLHVWQHGSIVALALIIAHFFLFESYEKRQPIRDSFHAGLFLGIGILFVPWIVVFVPLFLLHQAVYLRSATLRTFFAILFGALFPTMVVLVPSVITDDYICLTNWYLLLTDVLPVLPDNYLALTLQQAVSFILPALLTILGGLHYLSTSYNDKISVRMLLYIFVTDAFLILLFAVLQPQHLDYMLPSLLVCGLPLAVHFFALTKSWFTNTLFVLCMLCILALGGVTLFLPTIPLKDTLTILQSYI